MRNKCKLLIIATTTFMLMTSCAQVDNTNNPNDEFTNPEITQGGSSYDSETLDTHDGTYESDTSNDELKSYMNCFVGYFHEPFSIGEIQYPDTILGLVFEYCFYNHDKLNGVEIDETSFKVSINSADFQEIASYLLGDGFEVTKDPRWILLSGRYDEAVDRYVTSFAKDHWGGDSFSIEFGSELAIKEENGKVYVTTNVGVWDEVNGNYVPPRTLEYVFNIVEGNGMLHYQIEQISLVE